MSDPINITAIYDINTGRDRFEITDSIAAEILRLGLKHSQHGLPITPQTITMPPTKPPANQCQGDDAAGQHLYNLMTQNLAIGHDTADCAADAIIAAILRGEVPGITTTAQHLEPWREVAELRNDVEILRGTVKATVAERDKARNALALAERKLSVWIKRSDEGFASFRENVEILSSERDKALVDLAAERKAGDETVKLVQEQAKVIAERNEQIAAMKEQLERSMLEAGETQDAFKRECAEHAACNGALREVKADAERAKSEFNKEHVHTLRANKLLFEAMSVMRRWGNLCHGEYPSLDARIDDHLSRKRPNATSHQAGASPALVQTLVGQTEPEQKP